MSNNINDPAFPVLVDDFSKLIAPGLSKREYFAVMAMQGYLSNSGHDIGNVLNKTMSVSKAAVLVADALLKELDSTKDVN